MPNPPLSYLGREGPRTKAEQKKRLDELLWLYQDPNLSQADIAKAAGISRTRVGQILRNVGAITSPGKVYRGYQKFRRKLTTVGKVERRIKYRVRFWSISWWIRDFYLRTGRSPTVKEVWLGYWGLPACKAPYNNLASYLGHRQGEKASRRIRLLFQMAGVSVRPSGYYGSPSARPPN